MPALSATLACAKKRGVVKFEGTMLMQGSSDNVLITLVKDEIEDSNVFKSTYQQGPLIDLSKGTNQFGGGDSKCHTCGKTVYATERLAANGKVQS